MNSLKFHPLKWNRIYVYHIFSKKMYFQFQLLFVWLVLLRQFFFYSVNNDNKLWCLLLGLWEKTVAYCYCYNGFVITLLLLTLLVFSMDNLMWAALNKFSKWQSRVSVQVAFLTFKIVLIGVYTIITKPISKKSDETKKGYQNANHNVRGYIFICFCFFFLNSL